MAKTKLLRACQTHPTDKKTRSPTRYAHASARRALVLCSGDTTIRKPTSGTRTAARACSVENNCVGLCFDPREVIIIMYEVGENPSPSPPGRGSAVRARAARIAPPSWALPKTDFFLAILRGAGAKLMIFEYRFDLCAPLAARLRKFVCADIPYAGRART